MNLDKLKDYNESGWRYGASAMVILGGVVAATAGAAGAAVVTGAAIVGGAAGAADITLSTIAGNLNQKSKAIQEQKIADFIEDLTNNNTALTLDDLSSEPILHAGVLAIEAILKTRSREKRRYFAHLFMQFKLLGGFTDEDIDLYEEDRRIIDDMSEREMKLLIALQHFHESLKVKGVDASRTDIMQLLELLPGLKIEEDEVNDLLQRASRTGFLTPTPGQATHRKLQFKTNSSFLAFKNRLGLQ